MINFTEVTMTQIEEAIVSAREQKNLTQTELGEKIGVKKSRMSIIEQNMGSVSTDKFIRLIKELGCSLHFKPNIDTSLNPAEMMSFLEQILEDWKEGQITSDFALRKISRKLAKK